MPLPATPRSVIERELRNAARMQYPVKVWREHEWWADRVDGFVVGVSERWIAVQRLVDSVYIDGYEVVRLKDVTEVEDDRECSYVERAVADLGRPKVDFRLPAGATTGEVLQAAAEHSALIGVHIEKDDADALFVGSITRLGKRKFDIQIIGPRGVWVAEPARLRFKDVTRVTFGDRYSAQLHRFGEKRPSI